VNIYVWPMPVGALDIAASKVRHLSHGERGYGLSVERNPSPGSLTRSDLSLWER
jgi:hypothetical protein